MKLGIWVNHPKQTVHKRGEEESWGRKEQMEMNVTGNLWQDSSKSQREGLQDSSATPMMYGLEIVVLTERK